MNDAFLHAVQRVADFEWTTGAVEALVDHMDQDGGHDLAHIQRVLVNAHTIWQGEGATADWPVIAAAVLFHDAVNVPKNHPDRSKASTFSAEFGVNYMRAHLDETRLDTLFHAIRDHSFSSGFVPEIPEAKIVCDADRLEAIGAVGIARTFYVSGMLNRSIAHMEDPFGESGRELDDAEYGVDHFFKKLLHVHERMATETGKRIAGERHTYLVGFLHALSSELGVPWRGEA